MYNTDRAMSRANERLMSAAQHALDELGYVLDEMEMIAEQAPERDDIKACVAEVKAKSKKALTESWAAANHWSEHFDGLKGTNEEPPEEEKKTDDADEE